MTRGSHGSPERLQGAFFRAMGSLFLTKTADSSREALATALRTHLSSRGIDYHIRTLKRQLSGHVATVPPELEEAMRHLLLRANGMRTDADIETALTAAGLGKGWGPSRPAFVTTRRLLPLVDLWLFFNPGRPRRSLATLLARSLARDGVRLKVNPLQNILAGRQPLARSQVLDALLSALSTHGIVGEAQAREIIQARREEIAACSRSRALVSGKRLIDLAAAWRVRHRDPTSRQLAAQLERALADRGIGLGLHQIQLALEGKSRRVRRGLTDAMQELLSIELPEGRSIATEIATATNHTTRLQDLCRVRAEPIARLARAWLGGHPDVSQRQLAIRVARTARRMGYATSASTIQPVLGGHKRQSRGLVYRAVLKVLGEGKKPIPADHFLPARWAKKALAKRPRRAGPRAGHPELVDLPGASARPATLEIDPVRAYLVDVARHDVLGAEDEVRLAQVIEQAERETFHELLGSPTTTEDLVALASTLERGDPLPNDVLAGPNPTNADARRRASDRLRAILQEILPLARQDEPGRHRSRMAAMLDQVRFSSTRIRRWTELLGAFVETLRRAQLRGCVAGGRESGSIERAAGLRLENLEHTYQAARAALARADRARSEMTAANLRLVVSMAVKWQGNGLDLMDLIQEGNMGLMNAVERFDHRLGFKFSTYATWWVQRCLQRSIANQGRVIRLPAHVAEKMRKFWKSQNHAPPTDGAPSAVPHAPGGAGGLAPPRVVELIQLSRDTFSLDRPVLDGESTLIDCIADQTSMNPFAEVSHRDLAERVRDCLEELNPREAEVIRLRYGIGPEPPATLLQVGKRIGLTKERVRQIESRALERLRTAERGETLRGLLDEVGA